MRQLTLCANIHSVTLSLFFLGALSHITWMAFIVFEGLDGSGKTSLMRDLIKQLNRLQIPWVETREPGGTGLGDEIRELLLRKGLEVPHPRTELLLYEASRAQHVESFIKPNLAKKKWVLCDRYSASSLAFQGGGRAISSEEVLWLNRFATQGLKADLTVLLDLPVEVSLQRQKKRELLTGQVADRIESEGMAFHEKVRQSFLQQASQDSDCWLVLSAEKSPEELSLALHDELRLRKWLV
jgi:dTMP kinase